MKYYAVVRNFGDSIYVASETGTEQPTCIKLDQRSEAFGYRATIPKSEADVTPKDAIQRYIRKHVQAIEALEKNLKYAHEQIKKAEALQR